MYELSGRLFKNDRKEKGSKQPDYTGDYTDGDGKKWRLAGWIKDSNRPGGDTWLSLKVSEFEEKKTTVERAAELDFDDEMPF